MIIATLCLSCTKEYEVPTTVVNQDRDYLPQPTRTAVNDSLMVLGPQLANPYAVTIMQQARAQALAEDPSLTIPEIAVSHFYVRFLPANEEELNLLLQDTTITFYDYPLDREVISGTYYHDPAIADSLPTYQYASIPQQKWATMALSQDTPSYEVLAQLFIPEEVNGIGNNGGITINPGWGGGIILPIDPEDPEDPEDPWIPSPGPTDPGDEIGPNSTNTTSSTTSSTDWESIAAILVNKSMIITGHETEAEQNEYAEQMSDSGWIPSGRITAYDDIVNGPVPLVGVKVLVRRWFTTRTAITDATGFFSCNKGFSRPVNYSIKWESLRWDIREGDIGQAYYNGPKQDSSWQLYINHNASKSLAYASLHRALYRMYYKSLGGLSEPSRDRKIKIAYHHKNKGTVAGTHYNNWWHSIGIAPKIKIYGMYHINGVDIQRSPSSILSTLCHELGGHATHSYYCNTYSSLTTRYKEAWAVFAQFYLTYLEYKDLGVLDNIDIYTSEHPYIQEHDWNYNFQYWHKNDEYNPQLNDYPPLFVDIYDNYNQRDHVASTVENLYADDNVCFTNVYALKNMIFNSTNFSEVKAKFLALYNPNSSLNTYTLEDINSLFDFYEY